MKNERWDEKKDGSFSLSHFYLSSSHQQSYLPSHLSQPTSSLTNHHLNQNQKSTKQTWDKKKNKSIEHFKGDDVFRDIIFKYSRQEKEMTWHGRWGGWLWDGKWNGIYKEHHLTINHLPSHNLPSHLPSLPQQPFTISSTISSTMSFTILLIYHLMSWSFHYLSHQPSSDLTINHHLINHHISTCKIPW